MPGTAFGNKIQKSTFLSELSQLLQKHDVEIFVDMTDNLIAKCDTDHSYIEFGTTEGGAIINEYSTRSRIEKVISPGTYLVEVSREVTQTTKTITVKASSQKEAEQLAILESTESEWETEHSEYNIENIVRNNT